MLPVLRVSLVTACLVGVLAAGGCSSSSAGCAGGPCPAVVTTRLMYVMTVNGRSASLPRYGTPPSFRVRRGQYLHITIALTVPGHTTVTALSLGISTETYGGSPQHPIGVHPILARSRQPLAAGLHTFGLHWRIPKDQPGARLLLVSVWSTHRPPASVAQPIANLALN